MPSLFESKRNAILKYAGFYGCSLFVETGSGAGDMIDQVYPYFKQVFSIELDPDRYRECKARFSNAHSVNLLQGDSGKVLEAIIPFFTEPALIYLDAHYCGRGSAHGEQETPIIKELEMLLAAPKFNHVILIDDYADFVRNPAYPKPDALEAAVHKIQAGLRFEILKDGGGMILIVRASKKLLPNRKAVQVTEKVITGQAHPPVPLKAEPEVRPEEPRTFARPPILYGPYREGKEK